MMKKLCTTCFFGWQQMEKTKEEGHRKHIDQLIENTGLQMEELKTLMTNREEWKSFINSIFQRNSMTE